MKELLIKFVLNIVSAGILLVILWWGVRLFIKIVDKIRDIREQKSKKKKTKNHV